MTPDDTIRSSPVKFGALHFATVGALVLGIIFLACWLLIFTPVTATHAFIALFTTAEMTSFAALVQGLCWSLLFGAWTGFLIAIIHKFVASIWAR